MAIIFDAALSTGGNVVFSAAESGAVSYPYSLLSANHGTADPNSVLANANFATTGDVQLRIVSDTDPGKIYFDWSAIDAGQLWLDDIKALSAVTVNSTIETTDSFVMGWKTATAEGQFSATIQITADGTAIIDATPDPFQFTDQTDVPTDEYIESNAITVTGVDAGAEVPVTVYDGQYAVSTNGVDWGGFTSLTTNVQLNYQVKVRNRSSVNNSTSTTTSLDIGGETGTFTNTTIAAVGDTTPPAIVSVEVPSAGTYFPGYNLSFTVNFNESTVATGKPALNINVGGVSKKAVYASGSGSSALLFKYKIQAGDEDADGITVTSLTLDGGTLKDSAGNNANLTLNGVESPVGVIVTSAIAPPIVSRQRVKMELKTTTVRMSL